MKKMSSRIELDHFQSVITSGPLQPIDGDRFADVSIVPVQPAPRPRGFYPEDYYLVTPHVEQVSSFFLEMRDSFAVNPGYYGFKDEFFLRLAEAANWYTAHNPQTSSEDLLLAILVEAYVLRDLLEDENSMLWSPDAHIAIDNMSLLERPDPLSDVRPRSADEVNARLFEFRKGSVRP